MNRLPRLQARVFSLTWLCYATFYLTRKNFAVVKTRLNQTLGLTDGALGGIEAFYHIAYSLGQFGSGVLGDRLGPRRVLTIGLLLSALTAVGFGLGGGLLVFTVAYGLNGFCQLTGWPNNVKAIGPWFGRRQRGKIMGLWATNYQVGSVVATALASYLLIRFGWRSAFFVPAVLVALVALVLHFFLLIERPEDVGLPPVEKDEAPTKEGAGNMAPAEEGPTLREILRMPALWCLGGAYFGLKLVRYTLWGWLPRYFYQQLHYDEGLSGYLSIAFDIGGTIGAISIGWISDRYFPGRRLHLAAPTILALSGALWLYQQVGAGSVLANALCLALVGFLLFGPDTLISGAAAQDIGGRRATGTVAGIINGLGSLGAVAQALLTPIIKERWGWGPIFSAFVVITFLSGLLLMGLAYFSPQAGQAKD